MKKFIQKRKSFHWGFLRLKKRLNKYTELRHSNYEILLDTGRIDG